jgi:NADPH2:quinone reductase
VEDAASFFVNPYTAIGILEAAKEQGAKAIIHTAAASQLGQMLVKLALTEGIEIIKVVRREEQAELLKSIGAKRVVVTGIGDSYKEELKSKVEELLGVTVAFDAEVPTAYTVYSNRQQYEYWIARWSGGHMAYCTLVKI